ncbi:MAG: GNAT family N-acetyltransferase [Halanaeroarchaeum sp.]
MDVRVEAATIDDVEAVVERWVALVEDQRQYGAHIFGEANRDLATSTLQQYVHADGLAVARVPSTDAPVGFVMYYVERGMYDQDVTRGFVENVFVDPGARDGGVGSALMDFAEAELADRGVDVVALSAMAANDRVIDFYRERGYEPHRVELERHLERD